MAEIKKIGLADWIAAVRQEVEEASAKYVVLRAERLLADAPPPAPFALEDIVLEAAVSTERTDGGEIGFKVWLLEGKALDGASTQRTQRVTIRLKPQEQVPLGDKPSRAGSRKASKHGSR